MTVTRAGLAAILALSADQPAGPVVRAFRTPLTDLSAAQLEAGDILPALFRLGVPTDLAMLGRWWPRALVPAWTRLVRLPETASSAIAMRLLAVYTGASTLVVLLLRTMHVNWIYGPVEELAASMGQTTALAGVLRTCEVTAILGLVLTLLFGWLSRPEGPRILGRRHLDLARAGAICAALAETGAPADVRRKAAQALGVPASSGATVDELDAFSARHEGIARRLDAAVLAASRIVGPALLAVAAAATTLGMYVTVAGLYP